MTDNSPGIPIGTAAAFYMALMVVAAVLGWLFDVNIIWRGGVDSWGNVGLSLLAGIGAGLAVVTASHAMDRMFPWARRLNSDLAGLLGEVTLGSAFALACLSGVGEELFFRGFLQHGVEQWTGSPWGAVAVVGVMFGLLHIGPDPRRFAPWTIMAIVLGWLIGGLFVVTGNVFAPIAAHFTINFLNLATLINRRSES